MAEDKKPEEKAETQKEFYVAEVPASYQKVLMFGENVVNAEVLIAVMANKLVENGLLKVKDFEGK